jgi:hypothetical protein
VDLGDGVLGASARAKAVRARQRVRLEDRLQHQLERGLCHAVAHGRDPQHPQLAAARLGDQPLPHGQGTKPAGLEIGAQFGEKALLATPLLDVVDGLAVHPSRACPLVLPDPAPRHQQHRRVAHEVEQVSKPTVGIIGCPSVQLGLDLQYPRLRLLGGGPRRAGVHQRPPGLPAPRLRACCLPWPCGRLSRPRTTTEAPPHPATLSRRRACPPPARPAGGKGDRRVVPTFTTRPVDGIGAQLFPGSLATGTPQSFPMASRSAERQPTPESPAPHRSRACTADRPRSTRFEPAELLSGVPPLVPALVRLSVLLAGPGPSGGTGPSHRCRGCFPPSLAPPRSGCPQLHRPAATGRWWSPSISTRSQGASWRTRSTTQRRRPSLVDDSISRRAIRAVIPRRRR